MNLEWIILAEGFGTNSSGAMTAISINQNVVTAPALPVTTKRVVMAHFVEDNEESRSIGGEDVAVSVQVRNPSGESIFDANGGGKFPARVWPDLPTGLDIAVELQLRIAEYGKHEISVSVTATEDVKIEGRTYLYVKKPLT